MKKSQLTELVKNVVKETRAIKEADFNGNMSPQEKIELKKLEQAKLGLARANMQSAQKNISNIR